MKLLAVPILAGSMLGHALSASADVGDSSKAAVAATSVRHPWVGLRPRVDGTDPSGGGLVQLVWERLAEPEERRYSVVIVRNRSEQETYERTTVRPGYTIGLPAPNDLREAISATALADFSASTRVATVTSPSLQLTQTFYRGKRWGYVVARATVTTNGVRNTMWTQIALPSLAQEIRSARACAKTGECGE